MIATPSAARERLQLAYALDPAQLFRHVTGHNADTWQARLLRSQSRRILLNCCRQSGKTTSTAVLVAHQALYTPGSLSLILAPTERQSKELFRLVKRYWRMLGSTPAALSETSTSLELSNGARVAALPENPAGVRGYSGASLLVLDEASQLDDLAYDAVLPMVGVSRGRILALSTPNGQRGWWYDRWVSGGDIWERYRVPVTEPEIAARTDPLVLEEAKQRGEWFLRQEYFCEFGDNVASLFSVADLDSATSADVAAWEW